MTTDDNGESVINNLKNAIVGKVASLISTHNSDTNSHSDIRNAINNISASGPVTVEKQDEAEDGYIATYVIKQNGNQVGSKINIPKDFLVKSGTVETCVFLNQPVGCNVGDKYIDLIINTKANPETDEHIYIKVTDLIDTYEGDTAGTITITDNKIGLSTSIKNTINGKVDKVSGKSLVADTEITKLSHVEDYANKTTIDTALSTTSTNPLTNAKTTAALNNRLPLTGGTMTGNIKMPSDADSTNNEATGHIPFAQTIQDTTKTVKEILPTKKSFIGAVIGKKLDGSSGNQYDYVISARHRNGGGDGYKYGMYIRAPFSTNGNLLWAESNNGDYGAEKTILDSNNYSTYASPTTHTHDGTYIKTGSGTVTSTNIADKTIVNGDIADNAAIAYSKLNGVAASTHSHSYLPLSGGTLTGGVLHPVTRIGTSNAQYDNLVWAGAFDINTNLMTTVKANKSMLGTASFDSNWWSVISVRHRNGSGDGNAWGLIIKAPLTTNTSEANANLTWQRDLNGNASTEKTIIDTNNMVQHKVVNNVLSHATNNQNTAGYFKILTIAISGNYIDSPIQFTINRRLTPTTNVQFYVQYYQKDTSSSSNPRYYKLSKCYYDGQALGIYVKQTVDNAGAGTFDIYTDAEAWSDLSVTPIITNNSRNTPNNVTITPQNTFVTSLPSGYIQATRNPNYVDGSDSRLTNARTPTSHTDSNGAYGKATTSVWGHTKLNSATNSTDETTAATPKAVKAAYDLANGKAPSSHTHTKSQITDFPTSMTPTSHTHGSIANGGTLNSDITSVNKVAVTDSSNNLKTISKVPFANLNITKANITGLGIPGSDTNTTYSAGTGLSLSSTTFSVKYGTAAGTACQGNDSRITNLLSNSVKLSFRTSNSISAGIINPMSVSISKGSSIYIGCVDLNGNAKTDGNVGILVSGVNSIGLKAVSNGIASSAINYNAGNYFLTVSYFDSGNQAVASMVGKLTVT